MQKSIEKFLLIYPFPNHLHQIMWLYHLAFLIGLYPYFSINTRTRDYHIKSRRQINPVAELHQKQLAESKAQNKSQVSRDSIPSPKKVKNKIKRSE